MARRIAPYGSWSSPITAAAIAGGALRLSEPRLDGGLVHWLEGRPSEGGRQVVMRADPGRDTAPEACTPDDVNVRTLVHEYGGGDYTLHEGRLFFVAFADQRIHVAEGGRVAPLSPPGSRFADLVVTPDGRWLLAVEERPQEVGEPENRLVAFRLAPRGAELDVAAPRVVASGHDFYAAPRVAPAGDRIAFVAWDHPAMPWDATRLYLAAWGADGPAGDPRPVWGGPGESIQQPLFSPAGALTFVSDRSGWWNLHQLRGDAVVDLCPRAEEFGAPPWVFAQARYAFVGEDRILCAHGAGGRQRLSLLEPASGRLDDLALPYDGFGGVRVEAGRACFLATSAKSPPAVVALELASGRHRELRHGSSLVLDPAGLTDPEAIEFPSLDGRVAHAWLHRPSSVDHAGPSGARPPLLVKSHGGPTSAASPALDLRTQFWTSRGFAVVDVDYGGSSGYGRAYRDLLVGRWGVVDVDDCSQAAVFLAQQGTVDAGRLAISGGSAGGYTTLCALTFRDVFHAGASHYGIGDLEALARDTHKFEARYLDGLVGPYPQERARYVERSPIHHSERLSCPVIFFQGLEDRIVPPGQAEAMVAALAKRGIRHAYVPFEGEQHGFRRAENICTALEGELYFYSQIFGFEVDVHPPAVQIVG